MLTKPSILIPVDDIESATAFFTSGLGAEVKFRDGDRYCALRLEDLEIALLSQGERIVEGPALSLRSADLATDQRNLESMGACALGPPETGPHETRVIMTTGAGIAVVLSQKL